jgi:hypothetical protein
VPTLPAVATSLPATPQSMVDSGLPVETPAPVTTPAKPKTTQSKHKQDSTHPSPTTGSHGSEDDIGSVASAVRGSQLEPADGMPAPVATKTIANGQSGAWDGIAAIVSMFLPKGTRPSDTGGGHGVPSNDPARGVVISVGSGVHTALASQGSFLLDGTPLVDGQATVISGQTISVDSGTVYVNGVPQHHSSLDQPPMLQSPSAVPGQEHADDYHAGDDVQANGGNSILGADTGVDGSTNNAASEGTKDLTHVYSPDQAKNVALFTVNGHVYGAESKSGSLNINGAPASVGDTITINGDVLTIGSHAISFQGTTIALPDGSPDAAAATAGANAIIDGHTMTAFRDGAEVILGGKTLTMGQVTTISGSRISVASDGIVVGSSTAMFHDMDGSATNAGTTITIDGTVYTASTIVGQPDAVLLAGQTLRQGGTAVTIDGQVITNGPNGISVIKPTASATVTPATNLAKNMLVIDGTTYTATSVPGKSSVVVLQGQTLSVGGPAVTVDGHLITGGSNGISLVGSTSMSSGAKSKSPSSTEVPESSTTEDSESTPSEESSASVRGYGMGKSILSFAILFAMFMSL